MRIIRTAQDRVLSKWLVEGVERVRDVVSAEGADHAKTLFRAKYPAASVEVCEPLDHWSGKTGKPLGATAQRRPAGGRTMWLGWMETRNFDFNSLGETEQEAIDALRAGWDQHCREYRDATLTFDELLEGGSAVAVPIRVGGCLRDRDTLT